MTKFKLIGAMALSLMIASPAMATHQRHDPDGHDLAVQDSVHCGYHSGRGGLYGDGLYPDNVCADGGSHLIY
jgi:hypothetical protein